MKKEIIALKTLDCFIHILCLPFLIIGFIVAFMMQHLLSMFDKIEDLIVQKETEEIEKKIKEK